MLLLHTVQYEILHAVCTTLGHATFTYVLSWTDFHLSPTVRGTFESHRMQFWPIWHSGSQTHWKHTHTYTHTYRVFPAVHLVRNIAVEWNQPWNSSSRRPAALCLHTLLQRSLDSSAFGVSQILFFSVFLTCFWCNDVQIIMDLSRYTLVICDIYLKEPLQEQNVKFNTLAFRLNLLRALKFIHLMKTQHLKTWKFSKLVSNNREKYNY